MTRSTSNPQRRAALRSRALAQLTNPIVPPRERPDASAALGVLYQLASSPSTAAGALALLHELQVHQVEVDLQDEELRRSRIELEASLHRHVQLYDNAPVGYLTVDSNAVLREVNLTGAAMLGCERDFLRGRALDTFLAPGSVRTLHGMFAKLTGDAIAGSARLQLRRPDGQDHPIYASARLDPAGAGFLVALLPANH